MAHKILIYGGSGGIGSATGRILRDRGYDLHLVGRNQQKLSEVASELGARYTVGNVLDMDLFPRVMQDVGETLDGTSKPSGPSTSGASSG